MFTTRAATLPGTSALPKRSFQGPRLHAARLHRARLPMPGPPRSADWAKDGLTNIDDLTLACGKDNRLVKPGGWTTRKRKDGRTEWIPPPHLDSGNHESTTTTTPNIPAPEKTTTSLSYELTAFRFSIQAGIQCVTDLRRAP